MRTNLGRIKRAIERVLHPRRRRRAEERIRRQPAVSQVVVVCTGNVCRSPYAERALRQYLEKSGRAGVEVRSAGLLAQGDPPPQTAVRAARDRGVEVEDHRSNILSGDWIRPDGLVLAMDGRHASAARRLRIPASRVILLGDLDPDSIRVRAIPDPLGRSVEEFSECFERIDRCLGAFVELLKEGHPSSQSSSVGVRTGIPQSEDAVRVRCECAPAPGDRTTGDRTDAHRSSGSCVADQKA